MCIPLDGRISGKHVEITHQFVGGLHRWVVTDLQSMHGMFVRVSRTVLADKAEFLVGNGRYRFDDPQAGADETADQATNAGNFSETQGLSDGPGAFRPPALTELLGKEIGNRALLVKNEYWIGSDPSCPICRPDDPFCEPRHVRLVPRRLKRRLARRTPQDAQWSLATNAPDHRRIGGPVSDRRTTISTQGEVTTHGDLPQRLQRIRSTTEGTENTEEFDY